MDFQTINNYLKMKRLFLSITTIIIFLFFFVSCYYDNEEALYPTITTVCDTSNVTFSVTITSILSNNCYSCHSNGNSSFGGGIRLQDISDVMTNSARVVASIKQTGPFPMPPGGKLGSCSIIQFDIWLRNGMPNN
jgi:hypothetical protein